MTDETVAETDAAVGADAAAGPAHMQVVRGEPDAFELAALVAGLAAAAARRPDDAPAVTGSSWTDRARGVRPSPVPSAPQAPGPHAWRWSLRG